MKRFTSLVRKRSGPIQGQGPIDPNAAPEENAARGVRLFCESGSQINAQGEGEGYIHLPAVVEAAESSPVAAKAAAYQIRKLIKENFTKPYVQYNAIMLIRILADNPGPSFTKNVDDKFVTTIKSLLQQGRDPSVRQILVETLHALETEKAYDKNLMPLTSMWIKERGMIMNGPPHPSRFPQQYAPNPNVVLQPSQPRSVKRLPPAAELAGRIEEARTSAQLLTQLTQSTPSSQVLDNGLMKEFAQRCQTAQRTLQVYMNCTDPAPDEATFQTLIEVSEQLNVAMSKNQRAVLAARRESAQSPSAGTPAQSPPLTGAPTSFAPPIESHPGWIQQQTTPQAPPSTQAPVSRNTNPFLASTRGATAATTTTANPASQTPSQPVTAFPVATTAQTPAATAPATATATNPFSDDNQIPSRSPSTQQIPKPQQSSTTTDQNSNNIGATLAGPAPHSSLPLHQATEDDFEPPPGPPPKKTPTDPPPTQQYTSFSRPAPPETTYAANQPPSPPPKSATYTSQIRDYASNGGGGGAGGRPTTQESEDDLYGTSSSPVVAPARPSQQQLGSPKTSNSVGGRIVDDEPMSPMAPGDWGARNT